METQMELEGIEAPVRRVALIRSEAKLSLGELQETLATLRYDDPPGSEPKGRGPRVRLIRPVAIDTDAFLIGYSKVFDGAEQMPWESGYYDVQTKGTEEPWERVWFTQWIDARTGHASDGGWSKKCPLLFEPEDRYDRANNFLGWHSEIGASLYWRGLRAPLVSGSSEATSKRVKLIERA